MKGTLWTRAETADAIRLAGLNWSIAKIGRHIGRSAESVSNRLLRLRKRGADVPIRRNGRKRDKSLEAA